MKHIRFDPLAKRELADAVDYYDSKGENLGDALLLEVQKALHQLAAAPLSCPIIDEQLTCNS